MRWRRCGSPFQRNAVFNRRTWPLVHLTICSLRIRWSQRITPPVPKTIHSDVPHPPPKTSQFNKLWKRYNMFIVPSVAGCIMLLSTLLATQAALAGGLDGSLPPEALPPAPHAPHAHGTAFHFRPQHFPRSHPRRSPPRAEGRALAPLPGAGARWPRGARQRHRRQQNLVRDRDAMVIGIR